MVIKATEFKSNLKGHLEATRALEAMKVAFRSHMHRDSRVIEVADFNFVLLLTSV